LYTYKDIITAIGVNVWQKEFADFLKNELKINRRNLKNTLTFLNKNNIKFSIYSLFCHNTQLSIILESGVIIYFQLNKNNDFILHKVSLPIQ